jgi:hypothetical protein
VTASHRRTVTVVVAALGVAFVLVWAAVVGPADLAVHRVAPVPEQPAEPRQPDANQDTTTPEQTSDQQSPENAVSAGQLLQDAAAVGLVVGGLFFLGVLLRQLFLGIGRRLSDERLVVQLDPLPDTEAARAAGEREHGRQREALASADVRTGIVACWVVFEEAAAESHVAREPAETASAFVVRFLHSLDVDPRPVAELAQLFLEARFSTHPMPQDARPRAERALDAIHRDLVLAGAPS